MQFCDDCGEAMVKYEDDWVCRSCEPDRVDTDSDASPDLSGQAASAEVATLPTTDSGAVRKADAMEWLDSLKVPTDTELKRAVVPKPNGFEGSTYATAVSNVRITGDPNFVETVAGLFKAIGDMETDHTRVSINLQRAEDKETGEETGNYALYLSVAERA